MKTGVYEDLSIICRLTNLQL